MKTPKLAAAAVGLALLCGPTALLVTGKVMHRSDGLHVKIKHASVSGSPHAQDSVLVTFDYCNYAPAKVRLKSVQLNNDIVAIPLMQDAGVPIGCLTSTFVTFRMPDVEPGEYKAIMHFVFYEGRRKLDQTVTSEPFTVRAYGG